MFRKMEQEYVIGLLLLVWASAAKDRVVKTDEIENYSEIMKYVRNLEREMHGMKNHIRKMEQLGKEQTAQIEKESNEIELLKEEVADLMKSSDNDSQRVQNILNNMTTSTQTKWHCHLKTEDIYSQMPGTLTLGFPPTWTIVSVI